MSTPGQPDGAASPTAPTTVDSPEVTRLKAEVALEELRLRQARLGLEDAAARATSTKQIADGQIATAKSLLPASLDTTVEKDSLVVSGEPTGLSQVYVQRAAIALADDIADLIIEGLPDVAEVLLVQDETVLGDIDSFRLITSRLDALTTLLEMVAPAPAAPTPPEPCESADLSLKLFMPAMAGALAQLVPSGIGLASKLLAHQYNASGTTVDVVGAGFHLNVAGKLLMKQPDLILLLEQLRPTPKSRLMGGVAALAAAADQDLANAMRRASVDLAVTSGRVAQANTMLEAARARMLKLVETLDGTDSPSPSPLVSLLQLDLATEDRLIHRRLSADAAAQKQAEDQLITVRKRITDTLAKITDSADAGGPTARAQELALTRELEHQLIVDLPYFTRDAAEATAEHNSLTGTREMIDAFLLAVLTPPADGGRAPVLRAARAEWLTDDDVKTPRFLAHVRLLAGGVDQVLETKIGTDRRTVIAGAAAEFALIAHSGVVHASGVRSNLWGATAKLDKPHEFSSRNIDYIDVPTGSRRGFGRR